jgi:hypothetical protein
MTSFKRTLGLTALVATGLLFAACGGDSDTPDSGVANKDAGPTMTGDTGTTNTDATTGDTGARDGGGDGGMMGRDTGPRDATTPPPPPCAEGTEGCGCTFDPNDMTGRSNCGEGLNCFPWDLSDNEAAPANSTATCIRTCENNAECTGMGFGECTGAVSWQFDSRQIPFISYCAPTRAAVGEVCRGGRDGRNPVVGCTSGSSCQAGFDQSEAALPLEGTCTATCTWTTNDTRGTCGNGQVCNPFLATDTSTEAFGFCSRRINDVGTPCVQGDASQACAYASSTFCLQFQGDDQGSCVEVCSPNQPIAGECGATRNSPRDSAQAVTCEVAIAMGANGPVGLCDNNCSQFPNSCPNNTTCNQLGATFGMGNPAVNWATCLDLDGPFLASVAPTIANGQLTQVPQNAANCADPMAGQCSGGAACFGLDQAGTRGACFQLCSTSTDTAFLARYPRGGCETFTSTTVTCKTVNVMGFPADGGLCGL